MSVERTFGRLRTNWRCVVGRHNTQAELGIAYLALNLRRDSAAIDGMPINIVSRLLQLKEYGLSIRFLGIVPLVAPLSGQINRRSFNLTKFIRLFGQGERKENYGYRQSKANKITSI